MLNKDQIVRGTLTLFLSLFLVACAEFKPAELNTTEFGAPGGGGSLKPGPGQSLRTQRQVPPLAKSRATIKIADSETIKAEVIVVRHAKSEEQGKVPVKFRFNLTEEEFSKEKLIRVQTASKEFPNYEAEIYFSREYGVIIAMLENDGVTEKVYYFRSEFDEGDLKPRETMDSDIFEIFDFKKIHETDDTLLPIETLVEDIPKLLELKKLLPEVSATPKPLGLDELAAKTGTPSEIFSEQFVTAEPIPAAEPDDLDEERRKAQAELGMAIADGVDPTLAIDHGQAVEELMKPKIKKTPAP